uniref:DNA/RNA-binding protein Alba-like domain-containing protein n=1 Tax=Alexandrium monilatum TaxID=311494 RepID=A0A7S4VJZ2_9DINO|mmetsp:Transcript_23140/g.73263  ORF Transcript_23140/g.73263 Transcript_23140/m.73263 type:complete len:105 (-) Transcript_23140:56-370(-)
MSSVMEMKVSMKKGAGFYIRAASSFLKGVEAREASEGKEAVEAKAPVDELKISGLGEAINTAVTAASRAEADGLGTITKVETAYPDMSNGRGCAQVFITLKRKA